jgi:DNA repair protein RadD
MRLRPYQSDLETAIYAAWEQERAQNVLAVAATGSGKTVIFADVVQRHQGASVSVAHRQELVGQISLAVARNGVRHRLIGPQSVARNCMQLHLMELGRNYIEPSAAAAVAGVDTLIRMNPNDPWFKSVTLGVQDEAHHMLRDNKWGKAASMFPNAKWLGVTATPNRADGRGLGRHADGLFDTMVLAPSMRDLIRMGYLTDYRIFTIPSDVDLTNVPISAGGDFSPEPLRKAVHRSHIVGDVVQHYTRIAPGKLGVTFAVDVESATAIATAFNSVGVKAEVVSANTSDRDRISTLRRFRARDILQLVNVDLFGEGFDLPAIEVISFARPTHSWPLYVQQFGRAMRVMVDEKYWPYWDAYSDFERLQIIAASMKPKGIIIDHVGNVGRHGLPDRPRGHSLDAREKRNKSAVVIPVKTCGNCGATYERVEIRCPYCNHIPLVVGRGSPEMVDGDLYELDETTLMKMRGEIDKAPNLWVGASPVIVRSIVGSHWKKHEAQQGLRHAMAQWAGVRTQDQDPASDEMRRACKEFYFVFGIDVMTAQTLPAGEAADLAERIQRNMS